jgi:hypothetical protein
MGNVSLFAAIEAYPCVLALPATLDALAPAQRWQTLLHCWFRQQSGKPQHHSGDPASNARGGGGMPVGEWTG